jgi:hypothetical protein
MFAQAQEPLVAALATVGRRVRSVWDLVNTSESYPEAIPILLEHLTHPYPDRILEGIARALAVREAAQAWPQLASHYRSTKEDTNRDFKHGLAVALSVIASRSTIDQFIGLARDKANGESRILLLGAIRRSKAPEAKQALADLAADPQLRKAIDSRTKGSKKRR